MKGKYIFFCTFIIRNWKNTAVCGHTYLAFIGERKKPEKYDITLKSKMHTHALEPQSCAHIPHSRSFSKCKKERQMLGLMGLCHLDEHTEKNRHFVLEKIPRKIN